MGIKPEDTTKHQREYELPSSDGLLEMAENKETPSTSESDSDGSIALPADDQFLVVPIAGRGVPA